MKTIIIIIISTFFSFKVQAQTTVVTSTLSVKGNCDECKERIENAADIKGVKNSVWDETKQAISITYDTKKVSLDQIEKAIAKSGHETTHEKADIKAYNGLPSCCKYQHEECKKK
ncbi:MAG: heavy-metal-associated domain-containing protein [Bacteroidota bacterium]